MLCNYAISAAQSSKFQIAIRFRSEVLQNTDVVIVAADIATAVVLATEVVTDIVVVIEVGTDVVVVSNA